MIRCLTGDEILDPENGLDRLLIASAAADWFLLLPCDMPRALSELVLGVVGGTTRLYGAFAPCFEVGQVLVGILQVDQSENLYLGPHYIFRRLYVHEDFRRLGAGHALLRRAASELEFPQWPALTVMRRPLFRLYRKLGFQPLATTYACPAGVLIHYAKKARGCPQQQHPSSEAVSRS